MALLTRLRRETSFVVYTPALRFVLLNHYMAHIPTRIDGRYSVAPLKTDNPTLAFLRTGERADMCLALVLRKLQYANLVRLMSQESLVCPAQNARHDTRRRSWLSATLASPLKYT